MLRVAGGAVAAAGGLHLADPAGGRQASAEQATATSPAFVHPGLLHAAGDLERMRNAVAARQEPIYSGFLAMAADARSAHDYVVRNAGQITSWGRGPANFQSEAASDAGAAYQNALMWCVTGDARHADKARDILSAWSDSLRAITGADGQLGSGLQGFKLVNAAELLRHSGYDGWSSSDIESCEESFRTVWYRSLSGYALFANGNWDVAALQTIIGIAVFCDDPVLFDNAVRYAVAGAGNGRITHIVVDSAGQGQESGRSQAYAQLALGLLANTAAVAWNQGVDLFGHADNRILRGFEYNARYNLGDDGVPFTADLDRTGKYVKTSIASGNRARFQPIYEQAYAHYVGCLGMSAPHTERVIFRGENGQRVVEGGSDDHPGWGTLTQARPPAVSFAARVPPGFPSGLTAHGSSRGIVLAWAGPPPPWLSKDIGRVATAGRTSFDGERFVLEASGTAIAGTEDQFRFVCLPVRGDVTITARLTHPVSSQYASAGVMLRESLGAASAHVSMLVQGLPLHAWSGVWTVRPDAGAITTATGSRPVPPTQQAAITTNAGFPISNLGVLPRSATPLPAPYVEAASDGYRLRRPYWVRLRRMGNTCTGWISPDGTNWTKVGESTLRLGAELYAGLAACSALGIDQPYAGTTTVAFDNVSAGGWSVRPPDAPIGELRCRQGRSAIELAWSDPDPSATYTVKRGRAAAGPYQAIASRVGPVGFGVETRYADATGEPGTAYHYVVAKTNVAGAGPDSAPAVAIMPTPPPPVIDSATTAFANVGREFGYLISATNDPVRFSATGLPSGLTVDPATGVISGRPTAEGVFTVEITAHNATGSDPAALILSVATPPPDPWEYTDIGDYVLDERRLGTYSVASIRTPGITSHDARSGRFTVRGAGPGLNLINQGMSGHFAHVSLTGDHTITARVVSRDGGLAGLLMTKSLSPFDQLAGVVLGGSRQFVRRLRVATGLVTAEIPTGAGIPVWLRLRRLGETFTAETSGDGASWTVIGDPAPIAGFGDALYYAGLVVASGDAFVSRTTVFDSVSIT